MPIGTRLRLHHREGDGGIPGHPGMPGARVASLCDTGSLPHRIGKRETMPTTPPPPFLRDLLRPEAYPRPTNAVELRETHISWLLFTDDRVYKLKKPLRTPFLDYRDVSDRHHFCEEEVRLGRRLAPDTYRGVVAIRRGANGHTFVGDDEPVDWAVEMERLPVEAMLDRRLDEGRLPGDLVPRLAELLVRFHREAHGGPEIERYGRHQHLREVDRATRAGIHALCEGSGPGTTLPAELLALLSGRAERFLDTHRALFERRVGEHRIREGHGDLHAGNLCVQEREIIVYDAIEFSLPLRCLDLAAELGFLTMDLKFRGAGDLACELVDAVVERSQDAELPTLLPYYEAHYALVRCHVALLRAQQQEGAARDESVTTAERYLLHAWSVGSSPALVFLCGLPGTGKSHLARDLAQRFCLLHVQSDVLRKEAFGVPLNERTPATEVERVYSPEATERTYAALSTAVEAALRQGRSVIADANFPSRALRRPLVELAERMRVPWLCVECTADETTVRHRLEARTRDRNAVSDANLAVYESARDRFEPPSEIPAHRRLSLRSPLDPATAARAVALAFARQTRSARMP